MSLLVIGEIGIVREYNREPPGTIPPRVGGTGSAHIHAVRGPNASHFLHGRGFAPRPHPRSFKGDVEVKTRPGRCRQSEQTQQKRGGNGWHTTLVDISIPPNECAFASCSDLGVAGVSNLVGPNQ